MLSLRGKVLMLNEFNFVFFKKVTCWSMWKIMMIVSVDQENTWNTQQMNKITTSKCIFLFLKEPFKIKLDCKYTFITLKNVYKAQI